MKISLFLFGVMCTMFFIPTQCVYAMKRSHQGKSQSHRGKKFQATDIQQSVPTQDEDLAEMQEDMPDINVYIKKFPVKLKVLFFTAENLLNTNEIEKARPIYEKIIGETNNPLALFRLGEIYEKMVEEDPIFLTKSYDCFKLALTNASSAPFIMSMAIPKLLELGELLNQFLKESQSKPMSFEVQQMYR